MTTEIYLKKLGEYKNNLNDIVKIVVVPEANELIAETKNRVVIDGKSSTGNKIGNYSRKEGYYGREDFTNRGSFQGVGKNGGKPRKTMYLQQGYYQLRGIQGKENAFVNMDYSGDTRNRYQFNVSGNRVIFGMTTAKSALIREGNDKKFGVNIWASTRQQLEEFNKGVAQGQLELYNKTFSE
jgi:hypothetical protein